MNQEDCIIIGSGPAGLTAAIYAARADLNPLVFEGDAPGGQLLQTTDVENFPGFPDGVMGPALMNQMREQAKKFGARTVYKKVTKTDFSDSKKLKIWVDDELFTTKSLIIATGAQAKWLNLNQGEEKYWGKGYTACATCDGAFFRDKIVAVVGGGDSACEEASFLTKFASKVYLIHRRDELRASKPMQKRVISNPKIQIIWNQNVTELRGDKKLESVELTETDTAKKSELALDGLFVAIGHKPNTDIFKDQLKMDKQGYLINQSFTKTEIPSVFIAGDVTDHRYRQAITAAGWGCMAALDLEHYLASI